jgi:hypothetical protein
VPELQLRCHLFDWRPWRRSFGIHVLTPPPKGAGECTAFSEEQLNAHYMCVGWFRAGFDRRQIRVQVTACHCSFNGPPKPVRAPQRSTKPATEATQGTRLHQMLGSHCQRYRGRGGAPEYSLDNWSAVALVAQLQREADTIRPPGCSGAALCWASGTRRQAGGLELCWDGRRLRLAPPHMP